MAADTLVGRRVRLSAIPSFRALVKNQAPRTADQCIDVLERFLIRVLAHAALHETVATAIHEIERDHGRSGVSAIADRCRVSTRHLNRLMRLWVGCGPKTFANIARFQATLTEMQDAPARSGAALATERGYFDQAHLTMDVNRFAGATPHRLASRGMSDFSKTRCDDLP
jgi:transcriptional regulator GlxA family with amidase domain